MIVFPTSLLFGGLTPLKNMNSSVGMIAFPTEWNVIKHVPNHQPVYIGSCWLLELRQQLRTRGVGGWGGVGWDVNVHVNLRQQLMLRTRGGGGGGWGGMSTYM